MILELINKERKESQELQGKKNLITSYILKAIVFALVAVLEVYIFIALDKKIGSYSSYGSFDFLLLFLFIMIFVDVIFSVLKARKVFFNKIDSDVLLPLPIKSNEIIISKAFYIYLNEVITNYMISVPLLVTFGALRGFRPYFYVFCAIYPFIISLFNLGLTLLLVVPFEFIYRAVREKDWIQLIIASVLVITLCFVYKYVLDLFLNLLMNSNIGGTLNEGFLDGLHNASQFFVPVSNLLNPVVNKTNIIQNLLVFLGATVISLSAGFFASSMTYNHLSKNAITTSGKPKKDKPIIVQNSFKSLLKKEFVLLFRNSGYMFSYTSLLIMQPFLTMVVISSLSSIMYSNLKLFTVYMPEIINAINIMLILLFNSVINSGATLGITREGKGLQVMKYIPVDPFKMILAKLMIPTILSAGSFLITEILLILTGQISVVAFIVTLLVGLILIVALNVLGLYFDMKQHSSRKSNIGVLSTVLAFVLPMLIAGYVFLMQYSALNSTISYLLLILGVLILATPLVIFSKKILVKAFYNMEVN